MGTWFIILLAKFIMGLSRTLRLGGGSSLPGKVALRLDPRILERLRERADLRFVVVVTGSNGKTTTTRMIAGVLQGQGYRLIWNRTGANLTSGVVTAFVAACDLGGRVQADVAVLEVDEASLRRVIKPLQPSVVVVTNCFRDQLDRYGEVDTTVAYIRQALEALPPEAAVILNADDPLVAGLAEGLPQRVFYYGIEDSIPTEEEEQDRPQDARTCRNCGAYYEYRTVVYGHLGKYHCPQCGASRPLPDFRAVQVLPQGEQGFLCGLDSAYGVMKVSLGLPGLYNVYNCLGAAACCAVLGIPLSRIEAEIARSSAAFGRMEKIRLGEKEVLLVLVKNPVGFSEVLHTLFAKRGAKENVPGRGKVLVVCLNDRLADGRDISWIWDVNMKPLAERADELRRVVVSGIRAGDMALRLKYAGIQPEKITVEPDMAKALELGLEATAPGETLYVFPTYTAMLEMREHVRKRSHQQEFWRV